MTRKHAKHIETRLGARLLNRNSRNVSLSPRGTLRMSMPVWMSNPSFAKNLATYHQQNPHVNFDIDLSGRKINMVEEGVDLALRVAFKLDDGLIARKLAEVTFQKVAAPKSLDSFGRPKTPDDLNDAPILAYSQVAANGRIKFGGEKGMDIRLRPILTSSNESTLHQAAVAGMGFAMLPN